MIAQHSYYVEHSVGGYALVQQLHAHPVSKKYV